MDRAQQEDYKQHDEETEMDRTVRASKDEENHEMEIGFESEADLLQKLTTCTKNPGHTLFIPVRDFKESHLPPEYRSEDMMKLVQHQIGLAVRLRVSGSSPHRPKLFPGTDIEYPFASFRDRRRPRVGSGWVECVMKYPDLEKKSCPCETCQKSYEPVDRWAEIGIRTAAHVVYDIIEGKKTTCYFFYDSDDMPLASCPALKSAVDVKAAAATDTCYMTFITHNMDLVGRLFADVSQYPLNRFTIRKMYNITPEKKESIGNMKSRLAAKMSQGLELGTGETKKLDTMIKTDENAFLDLTEQLVNTFFQGTGKGFDLRKEMQTILRDKMKDVEEDAEVSEGVESQNLGASGISIPASSSVGVKDQHGSLYSNSAERRDRKEDAQTQSVESAGAARCMAAESGRKSQSDPPGEIPPTERENSEVSRNQSTSDGSDEASAGAESFPERSKFVPSHSLTIMISHPHGRSKRITVGHITKRETHWGDNFSMYTYTNATCPGSSGARVFILGKTSLGDHAHSKFGGVQTGGQTQINESVIGPDI